MDGIININKSQGITSFDVIRSLRKILKIKKIGHTGTLDPLARGVLIVCVGGATKLAQDIEGFYKTYLAEFELGYATDTYDSTGNIIKKSCDVEVTESEIIDVIHSFLGESLQTPPMYSAIKIGGQKLYDLARKGVEVERASRPVDIKEIQIIEIYKNKVTFRCTVSKGTYIRSLIYDIGEKLGTFATMTKLLRERVGDIDISSTFTLEEIENLYGENNLSFIKSVEDFFVYPKIEIVGEKNITLFKNGNTVIYNSSNGKYRIYSQDKFLGLGNIVNNRLKGYKYF